MPISRTTLLRAAGTQNLGQRTNAPTELANHKSVTGLTLHHVLPYRYMLCVGYLVDLYRVTFFPGVNNWPDGTDDDRSKTINTIMKGMIQFGGQLTLPHKFAWLGYGVFQGPSGNFRVDDPGSNREPHKPISMRSTIWDTLGGLEAFLNGKVTLSSSAGSYHAKFDQDFTVGDLDDMMKNYLLELAKGGHSNALSFCLSDWIVMRSTSTANALPQGIPGEAHKAKFRGWVRSAVKPAHLQCYTPDDAQAAAGTTLLWYLRSSAELQPAAFNNGAIRIS